MPIARITQIKRSLSFALILAFLFSFGSSLTISKFGIFYLNIMALTIDVANSISATATATVANNPFITHLFAAQTRPYPGTFNITAIFSIVFSAVSI